MLRFEGVTKSYGQHTAVDNLILEVERGELVVLIGPSGCGKTTTLRMANRMIEPTSGDILLEGKSVRSYDPVKLRRGIGYVIQQVGLFPHMTVGENIEVVPRLLGWPEKRRHERVTELIELVGMDPTTTRQRYPYHLSGGQQQRIGVLRALAADPELILMDEPFGALDPIMREQLQGELRRLQRAVRKTIVFVTHDMDEALRLADRIAIIREGRLLQFDTPAEILKNPADAFVASFVGRHRMREEALPRLVRDVMNAKPVLADVAERAEEAFARMQSRRVDTVLVVNGGQRLVGYLSAWHMAKGDFKGKSVGEIAENSVAVVKPDDEAQEAFARMDAERHPYVAVVDGERLVGIVTRGSMVRALASAVWGEDAS